MVLNEKKYNFNGKHEHSVYKTKYNGLKLELTVKLTLQQWKIEKDGRK